MNRVQHFLIPVDDMHRAKAFYQDVFQWDIDDTQDLYDQYQHAQTIDESKARDPDNLHAINGGLFERGNHGLSSTAIVVEVDSIDPFLKKAQNKNCKVLLPKTSVGSKGYYAQISDTEGNVVGLWEKKLTA